MLKTVLLVSILLAGCGTYKDNEIWRRSICSDIIESDERIRCEEQAGQSESDYKQDVEEALDN